MTLIIHVIIHVLFNTILSIHERRKTTKSDVSTLESNVNLLIITQF